VLKRLSIENYGLIERAEVAFSDAATIFTGETGSGKTMLVGALSFVLGVRADPAMVRAGAARAVVELVFEPDATLLRRLNDDGFALETGEEAAILRELTEAGKSSLRLCGRSATAGYVRELAPTIAEIVGQHEAQRLLAAPYHLEMLDRFAGDEALRVRSETAHAYVRASELREALVQTQANERYAAQRVDDARHAIDEISAGAPEAGEDERLTSRRRYLDNVERIAVGLRGAHDALAGDEGSVVSALGSAGAAVSSLRGVAPALEQIGEQLSALQSEANDLAATIARELDGTEYDPRELERINSRLDLLDRLKRKYGGTIDAVLESVREAERIVDEHERKDERAAEMAAALAAAERELEATAGRLGALRRAAAKRLAQGVRREFPDLALASGTFDVVVEPLDTIGPNGAERVEFAFSANAGEGTRPLAKIVSGGELSRVLLALVVALAQARERTALVFDEIDAGIGGATAVAVGARIGRLAKSGQVICITHLAQLATWASRHYVLEKHEHRKVTTIAVREIAGAAERTNEIARMLSGESHDTALKHARELLARAR
jgi:DNA repair protein RecN (Recombination protein N)